MSDGSEAESQARARVGDVLNDKWTLERLLGVGGMGAVYAGRHRNGAKAAVKVLHRALSLHPEVRARFLREGYAANRVDRPGVVKVLDDDVVVGGRDDGTAYIVMEILEGQSLEGRMAAGWQVTERQFLAIADAVLDVLDAAHKSGVVHRDIKPDNLFIATDESGVERVKVLDFGLARLLEGRSTTSHGLAIGTPAFMSPEQAGGRNAEIDGRTDIFSLAATAFRVVTGRRVHEAATPIEVMAKMATVPAPRLRAVAPLVSEAFARVVDRGLEFRREDRYQTAAEMRADVQEAMAALDAGLVVPGPAVVVAADKSTELSVRDFEPSLPAPAATVVTLAEPPPSVPSSAGRTLLIAPDSRKSGPRLDAPAVVLEGVPRAADAVSAPPPVDPVAQEPASPPAPPEPPAPQPESPPADALPQSYGEESLAAIPVHRVSLVPVAVLAGVIVLGGAAALLGGRDSPDAPATVASTTAQPAPAVDAAAPLLDAEDPDAVAVDAPVVATAPRDAGVGKPRAFPPRPPMRGAVVPQVKAVPRRVKH